MCVCVCVYINHAGDDDAVPRIDTIHSYEMQSTMVVIAARSLHNFAADFSTPFSCFVCAVFWSSAWPVLTMIEIACVRVFQPEQCEYILQMDHVKFRSTTSVFFLFFSSEAVCTSIFAICHQRSRGLNIQ